MVQYIELVTCCLKTLVYNSVAASNDRKFVNATTRKIYLPNVC